MNTEYLNYLIDYINHNIYHTQDKNMLADLSMAKDMLLETPERFDITKTWLIVRRFFAPPHRAGSSLVSTLEKLEGLLPAILWDNASYLNPIKRKHTKQIVESMVPLVLRFHSSDNWNEIKRSPKLIQLTPEMTTLFDAFIDTPAFDFLDFDIARFYYTEGPHNTQHAFVTITGTPSVAAFDLICDEVAVLLTNPTVLQQVIIQLGK